MNGRGIQLCHVVPVGQSLNAELDIRSNYIFRYRETKRSLGGTR